jgi:hypothetical protein
VLKLGPELFARLNADQWVGTQTPVIYGEGGLSDDKIASIERQLGFPLPEDFKYFLGNITDPGGVLFEWENFRKQQYDEKIAWVLQGIEFDVDKNGLWLERWGTRPGELRIAQAIARRDFSSWPKLLPIYGHRFLAAEPCLPDNPVFSIMQTDIIYYGANLAHYLIQEFLEQDRYAFHTSEQRPRKIAIWSDFAEP